MFISLETGFRCVGQFKPRFCTSILVTFIATIPTLITTTQPAWFQICDKEQKFQLSAAECSKGLWLKKPLDVDCVCVHGVWTVSAGYCDEDARLLVGIGDCFSVQKTIRYILLLGNPLDPLAPSAYVLTAGLEYYEKVPGKGFNSILATDSFLLVAINPNNSNLRRSDHEVCLHVENDEKEKLVHIWKVPRRESHQFRWIGSGACPTTSSFDYHVGFGQVFTDSSVIPAETVSESCDQQCKTSPEKHRDSFQSTTDLPIPQGRSILLRPQNAQELERPLRKSKINWDKMNALNQKLSFIGGSDLTSDERERRKNVYLTRFRLSQPAVVHKREIREQTIRMVQSHMNFLLLGQSPVKINTFEYEYFQMARQIFSTVVPRDIIPPKFVNGLMRMWRQLLWESTDKFAYSETPNIPRHQRIMSTLTHCYTNVSKRPMAFVDKTNSSSHGCLNETVATFWNDTEDPKKPGQVLTILLSNTSIPKEVKFNLRKLDFVVEFAWKVAMFTHYRCAAWFESSAFDHSYLNAKLLSFFNHDVVKRWHNPEDSLKAYELIFDYVNFKDVAYAIDRVVEAARDGSAFQLWLSRPTLPVTDEDLPPLRRKRSSGKFKKGFYFWNRNAACVRKLSDPVNNFGYKLPRNCPAPWEFA